MMYEVVAKKASASYCFGAGRAGGAVSAAALASGSEPEPQPASSRDALKEPSSAPQENALLVFMLGYREVSRTVGYYSGVEDAVRLERDLGVTSTQLRQSM